MVQGSTYRVARGVLAVLLCVAAVLAAHSPAPGARASERICFPEAAPVIRDCIEGRFAQFWRDNGGLPVFGYPITPATMERNHDTGQVYLVQYFERQRFELHPENQWPYDVLLGRLGALWLEGAIDSNFNPGEKANPTEPHYFPKTGYTIGFSPPENEMGLPEGEWYVDYWYGHGLEFDGDPSAKSYSESLMLFGMPITAVRGSMTTETSFQVFERTILHWQGKQVTDPRWRIVPDRLGVWHYKYVARADHENRLAYP